MDVFLQTERLILRRFMDADVDALVELDADPEVMRYINGGRPTSREEIEREFLPRARTGAWAAIDRAGGEFFGWFGLHQRDERPRGELELGYRIRRASWGDGYATEGATALLEKAFTELGASVVWAQTMTVNAASRRVLEKTGLQYVRTFHLEWPEEIEGTAEGDVEYAITREEWQASR